MIPKKEWNIKASKKCLTCNSLFFALPYQLKKRLYCSRLCTSKSQEKRKTIVCEICNSIFYKALSRTSKYCSRKCYEIEWTIRSKKFKKDFHKGMTPWNKGKKLEKMRGSNHPSWKGGITPLVRSIRTMTIYKKWRSKIFERDDYTCVFCKKKGGYLNADHIQPFRLILRKNNITSLPAAENCLDLWNVENGRTLCAPCHRETKTYGYNYFTYETN